MSEAIKDSQPSPENPIRVRIIKDRFPYSSFGDERLRDIYEENVRSVCEGKGPVLISGDIIDEDMTPGVVFCRVAKSVENKDVYFVIPKDVVDFQL